MSLVAPRVTFLLAAALVAIAPTARALAQTTAPEATARVRGTVVDASGGVLPGVTVVATSVEGRRLGPVVTDAAGAFALDGVTAGAVTLDFQLAGFEPSNATLTVQPGHPGGDQPIVQRLELLALVESVVVRGESPRPPPPPLPVLQPVPEHDQLSVCGPARADAPVPLLGTIRSRPDDESKTLFAAGDQLLIDAGAVEGLVVGRNFIVRRRFPTALRYGRNVVVMGEHSSGLLQVVAVDALGATAVVVYACDEMMRGDYLTPFEPEPLRSADPIGSPVFDRAARILFADEGQPMGVTGRMMVLDRGSHDDVRVGQRFTLFRRSRFRDARPLVVGEGVVVAVRRASSTIHVEHSTDVIFFGDDGDWAAPQVPMTASGR